MELLNSSATAIAKAIWTRQVSAEEFGRACINRINEVNPRLNAVVQLPADAALRQARVADRMLAGGEVSGPFHGVPFTLRACNKTLTRCEPLLFLASFE